MKVNLEFRKIKSLGFLYEISEDGRILRNVKSKKQISIKLDMHHSNIGYYAAWISYKGKVKRLMIHSLVSECWLGEKPKGYEIDHIDRNAHNNHYTNLRYVTHSEQMKNRILSDRIIEQGKRNCAAYVETLKKPIQLDRIDGGDSLWFPSIQSTAVYLASLYGKKVEQMRYKLKKHRQVIFDFKVTYLWNAQTGHCGFTEQGTVEPAEIADCI